MKKANVVSDYRSAYPDAIKVRKNENLEIDKSRNDFPGWVWCATSTGKSGWVPEAYLKIGDNRATALCDYDATELTVKTGEVLSVQKELAGWALCEKENGETGWVPLDCLVVI